MICNAIPPRWGATVALDLAESPLFANLHLLNASSTERSSQNRSPCRASTVSVDAVLAEKAARILRGAKEVGVLVRKLVFDLRKVNVAHLVYLLAKILVWQE